MKYILRLIISPALLFIVLVKYNYHAFRHVYFAIRYGGEWITYANGDKQTIQDLFIELKKEKLNP